MTSGATLALAAATTTRSCRTSHRSYSCGQSGMRKAGDVANQIPTVLRMCVVTLIVAAC